MRRLVIFLFAALIFLFPPYYDQGWFSSDWGWMFITDAIPPYETDIWWFPWIVEFLILAVVNMLWKRSETSQQATLAGQAQPHSSPVAAPQANLTDEIAQWKKLLDDGAISDEEFAAKKRELLASR